MAEKKDKSKRADGPTGSDAAKKGYYGRDSHIPNDRYILTSDDKPHPNEEIKVAKDANGETDAKNIGG